MQVGGVYTEYAWGEEGIIVGHPEGSLPQSLSLSHHLMGPDHLFRFLHEKAISIRLVYVTIIGAFPCSCLIYLLTNSLPQ